MTRAIFMLAFYRMVALKIEFIFAVMTRIEISKRECQLSACGALNILCQIKLLYALFGDHLARLQH